MTTVKLFKKRKLFKRFPVINFCSFKSRQELVILFPLKSDLNEVYTLNPNKDFSDMSNFN